MRRSSSVRLRLRLQIIRDFPSPAEGTTRTLRIYVPDAYDTEPERRFPVLYMQDAQNLFDHPEAAVPVTWGVNICMDRLVLQHGLEPWIVVAVDHRGPRRIPDYSPWREPGYADSPGGPRYARFFVETLVPYVDRTYRTRTDRDSTAILGSSLGGLISLYIGWTHPERFGRVGAMSPSVMWSGRQLFRYWSRRASEPQRIYLDVGSRESFQAGELTLDYGTAVREFAQHLRSLGYQDSELRLVLDARGSHDEASWRRRLPAALRWLLA